jgi:hypothetical protein
LRLYVYARDTREQADIAKVLTRDEARRIAVNVGRKPMKTVFLFALLVLLHCPAYAETEGKVTRTLGWGAAPCSAWTNARTYRPKDAERIAFSWVLGFITSYNVYSPETGNVTKEMENDEVGAWVDNYCKDHPTDQVVLATYNFVQALVNP